MTELQRRAMTPQDITRIRFVSDPQLSPDGSCVAFVVTTLSEARDEYLANIWLTPTAGGVPRRFTTGPGRDTTPRWSPDGTRLAFVAERIPQKKPQLYVMPADGGEPVALTDLSNGVADPVWSPDGARLAFVSRVGGWTEPAEEDERRKSKPARVITSMKYKFNGEGFTYDRRKHLFVVSAQGGEPLQLTDGDWDDAEPTWSPDGQWLAFVSARHDERDYDNAADVWIVPAEGGEPRRATDTAGPLGHPAFAPDGQTIAYIGHRYLNEAGRQARLYTMPVAGGAPQCLTEDFDRPCMAALESFRPLWAPDATSLQVCVADQGNLHVYRAAAGRDGPPVRIIGGERQVTGLTASRDGTQLAFTATDPVTPAEVFTCRADGSEIRQLTDLNRTWRVESCCFPSRPRAAQYRNGYS